MAWTWLSIRVDLVWRIFAAARFHRFSQLADAIDTAFARRDRAHLSQFVLADGRRIGRPEFDDFDQGFIDGAAPGCPRRVLATKGLRNGVRAAGSGSRKR